MAIVSTQDPFNTTKAQSNLTAGKNLIASMPAGATSSATQSINRPAPTPVTPKPVSNQSGYINGVSPAEYARLDNLYKKPAITPPSTVGSTINTSNTKTPPSVVLPTATVPTQGATLSADVDTQAQNYANTIVDANKLTESKTNLDTTAKSIADYISGRNGETALTNAEYEANVDPKKVELNEITAQLNQETLAGRRRVEAVLNIPGITKEQAQDKINEIDRVNTSKQADLAVIYQAKNGAYETAKEIADRKVSAFLEVEKNKLDALQFTYTNNKELFNKQEQRQFETAQAERTRLLNEKSTELKAINDLAINALKNGASNSVVQKMQNAKTQAEAISYGGQFIDRESRLNNQSDREYKKAQINKLISESTSNLGADINVANIKELQGLPAETKNTMIVSSFLKNQKIGQTTRTKLADILGVVNATTELAQVRQTTGFEGISPLNRILDAKVFGAGIPFRESFMSTGGIQNRQYLDAINLKVQQWASGASLTSEQIAQVNKFTPRPTDSDTQVRTKMNGLVNFMNSQVKSYLQSEGVTFEPEKVDLFEVHDLLKDASPEQLAELKADGLIK